MLAGYFGGWIDTLLSRLTDIFFGIPFLLGAMVVLQSFTDRTIWTWSSAPWRSSAGPRSPASCAAR